MGLRPKRSRNILYYKGNTAQSTANAFAFFPLRFGLQRYGFLPYHFEKKRGLECLPPLGRGEAFEKQKPEMGTTDRHTPLSGVSGKSQQ